MPKPTVHDPFRNPSINGTVLTWSPYLRLAHDYRIPPMQRVYRKDRLGDYALHYFFSGRGEYHLNGKTYTIMPKTVFLVRPGCGYHFQLAAGAEIRMLNLHFDLNEIPESHCPFPCPDVHSEIKDPLPTDFPDFQRLSNYPAYEQVFFQLLDAADRHGAVAHLQSKGLLLEIIALLHADLNGGQKSATVQSHQLAVDKAIEYIHSQVGGRPTLEKMAEIAGVSRALFCRIFRQATGATPQKYLNRHRIRLASTELLYSDTPIKDIAARCGFADVHHFSRVFKSFAGTSPAGFRARHNLYE